MHVNVIILLHVYCLFFKDVKDLNLTPNPAYNPDNESRVSAPFVCPVTGLEMTGNFRFVFLWTCGCVFSERALKYINSNICHKVSMA